MENVLPGFESGGIMTGAKILQYKSYKVSIHNKDYCMGCSYPEDDWDVIAYGKTEEELIEELAKKYHHTGYFAHNVSIAVNPESWTIEIVEFFQVQFAGEILFTYESPEIVGYWSEYPKNDIMENFKKKFLESDAFKREAAKLAEIQAEQKAAILAKNKEEQDAKDLKKYQELQKKFGEVSQSSNTE